MVIEALSSYENANMALQELVFALQDEDFLVRSSAVTAIGISKNADAIPALKALLDDEKLSFFAVSALTAIGTPEALEAIGKKRVNR